MASAFGHAVFALALSAANKKVARNPKVMITGVVCSILPDLDVIAFDLGLPYHHMFGHRGFSHSLLFSIILAGVISFLVGKWLKVKRDQNWPIFLYLFLCAVSHGILDAMTTGGMGIAFLAPFSDDRFFLPFRMIKVSPLSIEAFFSQRGMAVLKSELVWIGVPSIIMISLSFLIRRKRVNT